MTNGWVDIKNADVILAMGGNPAENHPVGFKWFMEAQARRAARSSSPSIRGSPARRRSRTSTRRSVPAATSRSSSGSSATRSRRSATTRTTSRSTPTRPFIINDKFAFNDGVVLRLRRGEGHLRRRTTWAYDRREARQGLQGRSHAAGRALRLPAPEEARRPLHAGDGRADLRHAEGHVPQGLRASSPRPATPSASARSPTPSAGRSTRPACRSSAPPRCCSSSSATSVGRAAA